jgi:hypothetical protein
MFIYRTTMKLVTVVESSLSSPLFQLEGCWIDIPHWVFVYFTSKDSPETLGILTIDNNGNKKRNSSQGSLESHEMNIAISPIKMTKI